jgi:hypothetical protein
MDGRRPSASRLAQFGPGVPEEKAKKISRKHRANIEEMSRKCQENIKDSIIAYSSFIALAIVESSLARATRIALISSLGAASINIFDAERVDRPKDEPCEVVTKPHVRNLIRVKMIRFE